MPSQDDLYNAIGAVVKSSTGRKWWRKSGIQATPEEAYATIFLAESDSQEKDVVEILELAVESPTGETLTQVPWGTSNFVCQIEFFRSKKNDSASDAAMRMRQALRLEQRFWDLWLICSLSGKVKYIDFSTMFAEDIEPRTRLTFGLIANIFLPEPLADTDIHEIEKVDITITEKLFDGENEDTETIAIDNSN